MSSRPAWITAVVVLITLLAIVPETLVGADDGPTVDGEGREQAKPVATLPAVPTAVQHMDRMVTLQDIPIAVAPAVNLEAVAREDQARAIAGFAPRFAIPNPVLITPDTHGFWERVGRNTMVWRLRVSSPGAVSLNLGFTRYHMPQGGRLFIYSADLTRGIRPFTAIDNAAHGELWTPILPSDDIVVEVTIPADDRGQLLLELTAINVGYRGFGASVGPPSDPCHIDVVCPEGEPWRYEISSVGVISIAGTRACTGFMVNNTAGDQTPYFMTADHCGINAGNAASLVVDWNYETSSCGGTPDGTFSDSQTGSFFRSGYAGTDFTLVELDSDPDPAWGVTFAGWDRTGADACSAVGIHHPSVREKRISFEHDPTTTTSWMGETSPGDGTHVRVKDWDFGTTEGGSSGSPLFDQNHHAIGQLRGDNAMCGTIADTSYYGKFSVSWNGGGTASMRLRDWLDPGNTGATSIDTLVPGGRDCSGGGWEEADKIRAGDAAENGGFGWSVAVSGDVAVIGAREWGHKGSDAPGSAYVFRKIGAGWEQEGDKLLPDDGSPLDGYGFSVAVSGDVAVIGTSLFDNQQFPVRGSAYVFRKSGASWVQEAKLPHDSAEPDGFGASVAVSGNVAVIGASTDDDNGPFSGSAYVFRKNGASWVQEAKLLPADGANSEFLFGTAVSVSGDVAVIVSTFGAYVFRKNGASWVQEARLLTGADFMPFGAVAVSGDVAVIGAPGDDDNGTFSGSAYVFRKSGPSWVREAKLLPHDGAAHGFFGWSVGVSCDAAVIGAAYSAYVFRKSGASWVQEAKLPQDGADFFDLFGLRVAISGDVALVGASADSDKARGSGSAYVFRYLGGSDCNGNGVRDDCEIDPTDPDGDGEFSDDCNQNGVPDDCERFACCGPDPGQCGDATMEACNTIGGVWLGDSCIHCPEQNVAIGEEPGGVFTHVIGPPVACPGAGAGSRKAPGICPPDQFIDAWVSPEDGRMCHQFGVTGSPAIPADFFDPGSDPFSGFVCLRGVPLGSTPWGDFGQADTLVLRTTDPFDRCQVPPLTADPISIEVVALSLASVDPIDVIVSGNPQQWDVQVDLSVVAPPPGTLSATKTHCNGGTYTSALNVLPRFTFTKVTDPNEVRVLDTGLEGLDPVELIQDTPAAWVHDVDPPFDAEIDQCSTFHAGFDEISSKPDCDCNGNTIRDLCDMESGFSQDCNSNGVPDECDIDSGVALDCNTDGVPDACDIESGAALDCNTNRVADECDLESGFSQDCNGNGVPDECDIQTGISHDCTTNGVPDECDIADETSLDEDDNGIPDECEGCVVTRELPPCYVAGEPMTVRISYDPPAGTSEVTLHEIPPGAWFIIFSPDGGTYDPSAGWIEWQFSDDTPRTISYAVTPPADHIGSSCFQGAGNCNGTGNQPIEGAQCVGGCDDLGACCGDTPGECADEVRRGDCVGDQSVWYEGLPCDDPVVVCIVCPQDLNGDGDVGPADLASLLDNWGPCPEAPTACPWDINGDGDVGPPDLASLLDSWGQCPS